MSVPTAFANKLDYEVTIYVARPDEFLEFLGQNYVINEIEIVKNKDSIWVKYSGKHHHELIDIIKYSALAWNNVKSIKPTTTIIATVSYVDPADDVDKSFTEYHQVIETGDFRPLVTDIVNRNKNRFVNYEDDTYLSITFKKSEIVDFKELHKYLACIDHIVPALELTQNNFDQVIDEQLNQLLPKSFHSFVKETVYAICKDESSSKLSLKTKFYFIVKAAKELKVSIQNMNKE
jgi:hypothetical protein